MDCFARNDKKKEEAPDKGITLVSGAVNTLSVGISALAPFLYSCDIHAIGVKALCALAALGAATVIYRAVSVPHQTHAGDVVHILGVFVVPAFGISRLFAGHATGYNVAINNVF